MKFRVGQANFSKGEIAPVVSARWDVDQYNAALQRARNFVVMKYGGVTKRMGTYLVGYVEEDDYPNRLIPFEFNDDDTYAMNLEHGAMTLCADGGMVLEEHLAVASASQASTINIEVAYHDYSVGDVVFFRSIDGMLELNRRFFTVESVVDADNFTLADPCGVVVDSTGYTAFTGSGGGTTRVGTPPPPPPAPPPPPPPPPAPAPPDVSDLFEDGTQ